MRIQPTTAHAAPFQRDGEHHWLSAVPKNLSHLPRIHSRASIQSDEEPETKRNARGTLEKLKHERFLQKT